MLAPRWPSGEGSSAPRTCLSLHPLKRDAVDEVWLWALEHSMRLGGPHVLWEGLTMEEVWTLVWIQSTDVYVCALDGKRGDGQDTFD